VEALELAAGVAADEELLHVHDVTHSGGLHHLRVPLQLELAAILVFHPNPPKKYSFQNYEL
jgi:hypothetical protein